MITPIARPFSLSPILLLYFSTFPLSPPQFNPVSHSPHSFFPPPPHQGGCYSSLGHKVWLDVPSVSSVFRVSNTFSNSVSFSVDIYFLSFFVIPLPAPSPTFCHPSLTAVCRLFTQPTIQNGPLSLIFRERKCLIFGKSYRSHSYSELANTRQKCNL